MILKTIEFTAGEKIPSSPTELLQWLGCATVINVQGQDNSRCRCVVTLLHGNEPSGLKAVHRFLRSRQIPSVDTAFFIVSVQTALAEPAYTWRQMPGERDMNRCFSPPCNDQQGRLAKGILDCIDGLNPEAIIDIHNTSGDGPAFSVCTELSHWQMTLTSLFTHRMVVTDLRMGTLMEINRPDRPVVTIECGGAQGDYADNIAYEGLCHFLQAEELLPKLEQIDLDIYHHPVRLELMPGATIEYAENLVEGADVVMPTTIDHRNFGVVTPDIPLGWLSESQSLRLKNGSGIMPIEEYFRVSGGRLYPAHPLKLFMVTTNPRIAASDCLLYAVKELDHTEIHTLLHN